MKPGRLRRALLVPGRHLGDRRAARPRAGRRTSRSSTHPAMRRFMPLPRRCQRTTEASSARPCSTRCSDAPGRSTRASSREDRAPGRRSRTASTCTGAASKRSSGNGSRSAVGLGADHRHRRGRPARGRQREPRPDGSTAHTPVTPAGRYGRLCPVPKPDLDDVADEPRADPLRAPRRRRCPRASRRGAAAAPPVSTGPSRDAPPQARPASRPGSVQPVGGTDTLRLTPERGAA